MWNSCRLYVKKKSMHFRYSNGNPKFWPAFALPGLLQSSLLLLSNYPQHLGTEWSPALDLKVTRLHLHLELLHFEHDQWQQTSWSNCHWVVAVYLKIWPANKSMHAHIHTFPSEHAAQYLNYPCHDVCFSSNLTTHPPFSDPSMRCLHLFGDDLCLLFSFHLPALQLRCMRCEGHITRFLRQAKAVVSTWLCYRTTFVQ